MIAARIARIAAEHPDMTAVVGGDLTLSYSALLVAGDAARRHLRAAGVQPEDVVMVSAPLCWQSVATFVACADMGAVFMPVNPAWRETELSWLTERVAPSAVVIRDGDQARWLGAGVSSTRLLPVDGWEPSAPGQIGKPCGTEQPAGQPCSYLISSGSAGRPKIVPRTQGALLQGADNLAAASSIGLGHRLLCCVPLHFAMGYSSNLLAPLMSGATLILLEQFEPGAAARLIERHAIDFLWTSPVVFGLLADANVPASRLRSLKTCISGGAPLAPSLAEEWRDRYGLPIRNAYGSVETFTVAMQSDDPETPDCAGPTIPGIEVTILSGDKPASPDETGEIAVRGPCVFQQYLDELESSTVRRWNGFYRTGDLGRLDEAGQLYVAGRIRPWINTGGLKVDPIEIHRVLMELSGVRECSVEAEKGPRGLDVVAAALAVEPGAELERADVIRHCRQHLADYKIPRIIRFVDTLARDLTGKTPKPWKNLP